MLTRTIWRSSPSASTIVFSATCELAGLTSSGSSMSLSFVRPIARSCSSTGSASQAVEVVQVLLHDDVAAAGERRVLVADQDRVGAAAPSGFSVPSTKPSRSRSSKDLKPCTSSITRPSPEPARQPLGELEAQVEAVGADVEQQVAGRRAAVCRAPASSGNGCSSAGRGSPNSRSHTRGADAHHAGQLPLGDPEADRALEAADVGQQVADAVLGPRRTVSTRKIAASVIGVRTACEPVGPCGGGGLLVIGPP